MKLSKAIRDLCCSRDIQAGGSLRIEGDSIFKGDVAVEGWLDAPNIQTPCAGLFPDVEALEHAHRKLRPGMWALVGESFPAEIYRAEGKTWTATGEMYDPVVIRQTIVEKTETAAPAPDYTAAIGELTSAIADLSTRLAAAETLADSNREQLTEVTAQVSSLESRQAAAERANGIDHEQLENEIGELDTSLSDLYSDVTGAINTGRAALQSSFATFTGTYSESAYWWEESPNTVSEVRWHPQFHRFVGKDPDGEWVTNWKGADEYQQFAIADAGRRNVMPHRRKLFLNTAAKKFFFFNGTNLESVNDDTII